MQSQVVIASALRNPAVRERRSFVHEARLATPQHGYSEHHDVKARLSGRAAFRHRAQKP